MKLLTLFSFLLLGLCASAKIKISTLSPLITDLANQIGGDKVTVVDLLGKNGNPHTFSPTTQTLNSAAGSQLYIVSGKGLEPYLPKLKSLVGNANVLELGQNIRSLRIEGNSSTYACCPTHSSGAVDPHWWHSLENWRKASSTLATELAVLDPANKDYYMQRSKAYRKKLFGLKSWAKKELSKVPKANRQLVTAHAAFGYFCKEFGFQSIPLRGLNSEQSVTPQYLEEAVGIILKKQVKAIFPDESSNPSALKSASKATGVPMAGKLYADTHTSIEQMFAHNVRTITKALK